MSGIYEIDSLQLAYETFLHDEDLMNLIGGPAKVFKYHVPEENRQETPIIRIHPISELPTGYADNKQHAWDCILQIDVWDDSNARTIALKIHKLMKSINFKQSTPTFEYDPDTYLYRDCRRYRGVLISEKGE